MRISVSPTYSLQALSSHYVSVGPDGQHQSWFPSDICLHHGQGVKIYSSRVDSMHSEAYKVLGGLNRTEKPRSDGADEHGATRDRSRRALSEFVPSRCVCSHALPQAARQPVTWPCVHGLWRGTCSDQKEAAADHTELWQGWRH